MTTKKKSAEEQAEDQPLEEALPGAPAAPPKKDRKSESLHFSYLPAGDDVEHDGFIDAVPFGRKIDALEHAIAETTNDVRWAYVEVHKGESLHAAIHRV